MREVRTTVDRPGISDSPATYAYGQQAAKAGAAETARAKSDAMTSFMQTSWVGRR
jgi:hypothetical protein